MVEAYGEDKAEKEYGDILFYGAAAKKWCAAQIISYNFNSIEDVLSALQHYPNEKALSNAQSYSEIGSTLGGDYWDSSCLVPSGELIGVDVYEAYTVDKFMRIWNRFFKHNNINKEEVYNKLNLIINSFSKTHPHVIEIKKNEKLDNFDVYNSFYVQYYGEEKKVEMALLSSEDGEYTREFKATDLIENNSNYKVFQEKDGTPIVIINKVQFSLAPFDYDKLYDTYYEVHMVDFHSRPWEETIYEDDFFKIEILYGEDTVKNSMSNMHTVGTLAISILANKYHIDWWGSKADQECLKMIEGKYSPIMNKEKWVSADICYGDDYFDWQWFIRTYFNNKEEAAVAYQNKIVSVLRRKLEGIPVSYWYDTHQGIWLDEILEKAGAEEDNDTESYWLHIKKLPF